MADLIYPEAMARIDACLRRQLQTTGRGSPLEAALTDAVLGPGKRLRPLLTLGAYRYTAGKDITDGLLAVACASELLHAASLIYDDLPCMDDAVTRRGTPALHIAHGEATALLTAIGLQNMAYEWVAAAKDLPVDVRMSITHLFAQTVGVQGLAAGQYYDLNGSPAETRHLKTGILFCAAATAGALCAGADEASRNQIALYADRLGTAFQLLDDLEDHDAPEDEAKLKAEMQRLLAEATAALDPARAAPLKDYIALVFKS